MSSRTRLLEIMSAAGLAKLKDDQALREGQASAANTGQWINALRSIVPAATSALGAYQGSVADEAKTAAEQLAAAHVGDTGDAGATPGEYATKIAGADEALNPKKPTGLTDSLSAFFGDRAGAAAKAKADASTKIAAGVQGARDKVTTEADKAAALAAKAKPVDEPGDNSVDMGIAFDKAAALEPGTSPKSDELNAKDRAERKSVAEMVRAEALAKTAEKKADAKPGPKATVDTDLRHRKLVAEVAAAEAAAKTKGAPKPLEAKQADDFTAIDEALTQARQLAADKGEIDTGPIASARNFLAKKMGVDDPKVTEFKARTGDSLADYIRSISGGAVAKDERAALLDNVPTATDDDTAFMAKLDFVLKKLETKRELMMRSAKARHVDVSGFESGSDVSPRGRDLPASAGLPPGEW